MRFSPITLLLGANSSGKSSLIQALLLIRQTVKGGDDNQDLNLGNPDGGDSVELGQYKDVLCQHGSSKKIGIEFRWSPTGDTKDSAIFSARYRQGPAGSAEIEYLRLGKEGQAFIVERRRQGVYRLQLANERTSRRQHADFRPYKSFAFSQAALSRLGNAADSIRDVGPQLLHELNRIIYLGPVRRLAKRDYVWNGLMPATIGDDGAKAVDALIASGAASQKARSRNLSQPIEAELFNKTKYWLEAMGLADDLFVMSLGKSARYELLIRCKGESSNVKDVGVGVSQVIPVIVAALYASPGHIVIIEEPESHLHPLAETVLADLFIETSKTRNVQFIIETHSEHLMLRLQRRIAEQKTTPHEIAIYFCKRNGKEAIIEPLKLTSEGDIENWPENFFGDEMTELSERTIAAMNRRIEQRGNTNEDSSSD